MIPAAPSCDSCSYITASESDHLSSTAGHGHRFFIWTIGCQMNKADSERIGRELIAAGHSPVATLPEASTVIVNGCAVRDNSDRKVYGQLALLRGVKQKRPNLLVGLTGCTVHATPAELAPHVAAVNVQFDTLDISPLLELMSSALASDTPGFDDHGALTLPGTGAVSRFVNAIYGCDKRCTYCIVPFRRGAQRSRPIAEITAEVHRCSDEGAREVTLLGQIVNAYGEDLPDRPTLANLLMAVDRAGSVRRVRFTTAHPRYMTRDLAEAIRDVPSVCEELNLPVQAGDDLVLKRMARGYSTDFYRDKIAMLRETVPGIALSTDIIVGFCGESEGQFEHTLEFLDEMRFDQVHVAAFSPRIGTVASEWPDDVPAQEKMRRLHAVEALQTGIAREVNECLAGSTQTVLLEDLTPGKDDPQRFRWRGRTRSNKLVFIDDRPGLEAGETVDATITETTAWSLRGEVRAAVTV